MYSQNYITLKEGIQMHQTSYTMATHLAEPLNLKDEIETQRYHKETEESVRDTEVQWHMEITEQEQLADDIDRDYIPTRQMMNWTESTTRRR